MGYNGAMATKSMTEISDDRLKELAVNPPLTRGWSLEEATNIARECIRLREIVAKLPSTADGVPIFPGMTVHAPGGKNFAVAIGHVGQRSPIRLTNGKWIFVGDCYSTRDLALAQTIGLPDREPQPKMEAADVREAW